MFPPPWRRRSSANGASSARLQQFERSATRTGHREPRLRRVAADDERARRRPGAHGADDAGVDRSEVEVPDRLQVSEAGRDLFLHVLLAVGLVLDEQAAARLLVLHPADPGPHLLTRDAGALLGIHGVQAITPAPLLRERAPLDLD